MSKRIRFDNPSHLTKALLYISFEFYGPCIAFAFPFFLRQDVKFDLVFLILQLREEGFIFLNRQIQNMSFTSLFFKQSVQKRLDNSHWKYSVLYLEFHVRNAA